MSELKLGDQVRSLVTSHDDRDVVLEHGEIYTVFNFRWDQTVSPLIFVHKPGSNKPGAWCNIELFSRSDGHRFSYPASLLRNILSEYAIEPTRSLLRGYNDGNLRRLMELIEMEQQCRSDSIPYMINLDLNREIEV